MAFQGLTEHYENFMQEGSDWLSVGLAWTAVLPVEGRLSLSEVATRLIGDGQPPVIELDSEEAYEADAVLLGQMGNSTMIVETFGNNYVWESGVLDRLSVNAQVWHVSWEVTGNSRLIHAARGRVLAEVQHLNPADAVGEDLAAVEAELAALGPTISAPWPATQAMALAIVEARTGARLESDWFDRSHPAVIVGDPA
ncbi:MULTISPECIES: hypothetical protein [Streptosporangium]|uniref:Uncharacterized protein n=1 Tax=Streptosporangium brasiliense TaxID=47480 RepID=A0ABT9R666_9ACTN|nr:hypothetical protein [Streptosporangium brasiliense]MDP9862650.1 hypothetical protein [Streptosporangium brasiliense]MDP9864274.1 hypothetical protein [Streptosporangium brasiliense]